MRHGRHNKWAYETLNTLIKTSHISTSIIEDSRGVPLSEDSMILKRWTEYCNDLYNRQINPDISVLNSNANFNTYTEEEFPILESAVIEMIKTLKEGKSPGIDNIPSELVKYRGNAVVIILTTLCQKSRSSKIWPSQWTKSLIYQY